jgi:DNA gyrase/topoisomerase IV subunit A
MKPEIPSHNLGEVIDVTLRLMDDPAMDFILVPDHCLPCEIIDTDWRKIANGKALSYTVRSKIDIVQTDRGTHLVLRSFPNLTYLNNIDEAIEKLVQSGELAQIASIEDNSTE